VLDGAVVEHGTGPKTAAVLEASLSEHERGRNGAFVLRNGLRKHGRNPKALAVLEASLSEHRRG
jgi:hypothetical protein